MKKVLASILVLLTVTACSSGTAQTAAQTSAQTSAETSAGTMPATAASTAASTTAAPSQGSSVGALKLSGQKEVGEGTVYLSHAGDTTEDEKPVTILGGEGYMVLQIGIDYADFDGSKYTYIFVDGKEDFKEQWGLGGSTSINLKDDMLKNGLHTVEVIQWSGDNMTGDVTMYKTAQYEVKP